MRDNDIRAEENDNSLELKCSAKNNFLFNPSAFIEGFIISLILLLIILFFLPVGYGSNDDLIIVGILSGKDGFPPYSSGPYLYLAGTKQSFISIV
jgi:hypothetical protein